jgi:hypothetical protein
MFRPRFLLAALLCGTLFVGQAAARNVWLSLNLEFNTSGDFGSGGTWTVVAKADERGLAGIVLSFDANSLNFNAATGFLPGLDFEQSSGTFPGLRLEITEGDDVDNRTLDIGVIGGTFPSTYFDNPDLVPFGANPDLGTFTGGIALATGSFNPGDIPAWYDPDNNQIPNDLDANLYLNAVQNPVAPNAIFTTVRYVVPEPTSLLLLCGGMFALAGIRRC